jgi:DNA-binding NtrC family response regulator
MSTIALAPIVGSSVAIQHATALVERFAPTSLPIVLIGATGTGKELFARHIHQRSGRRGELVDVNCGALPAEIADSLLFGHRRGAFTGAIESVSGHLERADAGTLFLDEVLHLSASAQVKLLRALETGEVQPVGSGQKRHVDFRIVSAAQEDAPERLDRGSFRQDLFQRLAGIVIDLPLLVDRPEDVVPLAQHFAAKRGYVLESGAAKVLHQHSWPGNVRELRLAIERAGCLVENGTLPAGAVREAIELGTPPERRAKGRRGDRRTERAERRQLGSRGSWDELMRLCQEHGGDADRVAASLGIRRSALYERLKSMGISLRSIRKSTKPPELHQAVTQVADDRNLSCDPDRRIPDPHRFSGGIPPELRTNHLT